MLGNTLGDLWIRGEIVEPQYEIRIYFEAIER